MTNTPKSGKWKDAFLKSSLPLEYLSADKLRAKGCGIMGEYSYMRENEHGLAVECSVDVWAMRHYYKHRKEHWGTLNYLVECKYCHPSVRWVFMQHGKDDTEYLMDISPVQVMDHLCTRMIWDKRPIWNLRDRFPMCPKGVEIHSNDATSQNIDRGRSQLVYGLPRLISHLAEGEIMKWNDVDLEIEMSCPMLVTTAGLFILKPGLSLESFLQAKDLADIAGQVPALILTTPYSHMFSDYADHVISDLHNKNPEIKKRLKELRDVSGQTDDFPEVPSNYSFDFFIRECVYRLLVVNYDALEQVVEVVHKTILKSARSLQRVGTLEKDMSKRTTWVQPVNRKTGKSQQNNPADG